MRTQVQSIHTSGGRQRCQSRSRLAIHAAVVSCALGLVVAPGAGYSQTLDGAMTAVQPNAARPAERHRAHVTSDNLVADAAVVQTPILQTVRQDPHVRAAAKVRETTRSKPMNRTAQAHLETSRQAIGLPPVAMVCQDCEPQPPCGIYRCGNSPIVDGATIAVER
jgi:hypothetical protein